MPKAICRCHVHFHWNVRARTDSRLDLIKQCYTVCASAAADQAVASMIAISAGHIGKIPVDLPTVSRASALSS